MGNRQYIGDVRDMSIHLCQDRISGKWLLGIDAGETHIAFESAYDARAQMRTDVLYACSLILVTNGYAVTPPVVKCGECGGTGDGGFGDDVSGQPRPCPKCNGTGEAEGKSDGD